MASLHDPTAVAPQDASIEFPSRCVACLDPHVTFRTLTAAHELNFFLGGKTLSVLLEQELAQVPYCAVHIAQLDARGSSTGAGSAATYLPGAHERGTGTLGFAAMVDAQLDGTDNDRTVVVTATTFAFENAEYARLFREHNGFGTAEEYSRRQAGHDDETERDVAS